jgi:hypothetical protein
VTVTDEDSGRDPGPMDVPASQAHSRIKPRRSEARKVSFAGPERHERTSARHGNNGNAHGSLGIVRVRPHPRESLQNRSFSERAPPGTNVRPIAPRRSPVRVRLAPSKTLEIGTIPRVLSAFPGTGRESQALVKCVCVHSVGNGGGDGCTGAAVVERGGAPSCGCRKLGFPGAELIRGRRLGVWHSRRLGCGRLLC